MQGIKLENIEISDVYYYNKGYTRPTSSIHSANGNTPTGLGMLFKAFYKGKLKNVRVNDISITRTSHQGILMGGGFTERAVNDVDFSNINIYRTGGPGVQLTSADGITFRDSIVNQTGSTADSRNRKRGSGLWVWNTRNILVKNNAFMNANGPADSAGAHIDSKNSDIIFEYNLSYNNAGGFIEILGGNYGTTYRYNVSINDGWRKKSQYNKQSGKIFWLSGYDGQGNPSKGPHNSYIYNNTIYTKKEMENNFSIGKTTNGLLVANNIFYIMGTTRVVAGDQFVPDETGSIGGDNNQIIFDRNIVNFSGNEFLLKFNLQRFFRCCCFFLPSNPITACFLAISSKLY